MSEENQYIPKIFLQLGLSDNVTEDFKCLWPYFSNLTLKMVEGVDFDEWIDLVGVKDKIIMKIFIEKYFEPSIRASKIFYVKPNENIIKFQNGRLIGSHRAVSPFGFYIPGCLSTIDIEAWISKNVSVEDKIKLLNLSSNLLLNEDIIIISQMLARVENQYLAADFVLKLDHNKIHGYSGDFRQKVPNAIKDICSLSKVKYIDLSSNPFCSIDRQDFFLKLGPMKDILNKLIWIPEYLLEGQSWLMMTDQNDRQCIKDVHREYYGKMKWVP